MLFNFFYAYSLWNGLSAPSARYNAQALVGMFNHTLDIYPLLHESWANSGYRGGLIFPTNMSIEVGPDGPVLKNCHIDGILLGCLQELLFWDWNDPDVGAFPIEFDWYVRQRIYEILPKATFCCRCGSVEGVHHSLATAMLNSGGLVEAVDNCSHCRPKQCTHCLGFTNTKVPPEYIKNWDLVDGCQLCNEIIVCTNCGDVHYNLNREVEDLSKAKTVLVDNCHLCD